MLTTLIATCLWHRQAFGWGICISLHGLWWPLAPACTPLKVLKSASCHICFGGGCHGCLAVWVWRSYWEKKASTLKHTYLYEWLDLSDVQLLCCFESFLFNSRTLCIYVCLQHSPKGHKSVPMSRKWKNRLFEKEHGVGCLLSLRYNLQRK